MQHKTGKDFPSSSPVLCYRKHPRFGEVRRAGEHGLASQGLGQLACFKRQAGAKAEDQQGARSRELCRDPGSCAGGSAAHPQTRVIPSRSQTLEHQSIATPYWAAASLLTHGLLRLENKVLFQLSLAFFCSGPQGLVALAMASLPLRPCGSLGSSWRRAVLPRRRGGCSITRKKVPGQELLPETCGCLPRCLIPISFQKTLKASP